MSIIIHISGFAGVGKLTVARALTTRLHTIGDARLIDNHTIMNPAFALFPIGSPEWWRVVGEVRRAAYGALVDLPPYTAVVATNVLVVGSPSDEDVAAALREAAAARGATLLAVTLTAEPDEHRRRLTDPSRGRYKLTDWDTALWMQARYDLMQPGGWAHLGIDTTALSPEETAEAILAHPVVTAYALAVASESTARTDAEPTAVVATVESMPTG